MTSLPTEVWQCICEHTAERVIVFPNYGDEVEPADQEASHVHFLSLMGFGQASRRCRMIAVPYLFRRLRIRTTEQATLIVTSRIIQYIRHIHFPEVDILTCRRPIAASISKLVSGINSIRIGASDWTFALSARTLLGRILGAAKGLDRLELSFKPLLWRLDTMAFIAGLVPTFPKTLKTLYLAMPGGRPSYNGPEVLCKAFQSTDPSTPCALPHLKTIGLSVHLVPQVVGQQERVALGLARRLPALRQFTMVAPGPNPLLIEPQFDDIDEPSVISDGFTERVMRWHFGQDVDTVSGSDAGAERTRPADVRK